MSCIPIDLLAIQNTALSVIAMTQTYDKLTLKYPTGGCTAEQLDEALTVLRRDSLKLLNLCRDLKERVLLMGNSDGIWALTLNYHSCLVEVKLAANISGGLDELVRQPLYG